MKKISAKLKNKEGLHARPASILCAEAKKYESEIKIIKNSEEERICNPKSILSVLSLGAIKGDILTIMAEGSDESIAASNLNKLIENGLDE